MQAVVIRDTGAVERLDLPEFEDLQRACGGTVPAHDTGVETKHIDGRYVESPSILAPEFAHLTMWANEEGRIHGMAENHKATILVGWWGAEPAEAPEGWELIVVSDPDGPPMWMLVGDVVITGPTSRGNRTALSDADAEAIEKAAGNIVVLRHE